MGLWKYLHRRDRRSRRIAPHRHNHRSVVHRPYGARRAWHVTLTISRHRAWRVEPRGWEGVYTDAAAPRGWTHASD